MIYLIYDKTGIVFFASQHLGIKIFNIGKDNGEQIYITC